jgi:hypothetical protein
VTAQQHFVRKRIKGGFRRMLETELGEEQLCCSCGEPWPIDPEFFVVTATFLGYECKACTADRRAARTNRMQQHTYCAINEHLNRICFDIFSKKEQ